MNYKLSLKLNDNFFVFKVRCYIKNVFENNVVVIDMYILKYNLMIQNICRKLFMSGNICVLNTP